MSPLFHALRRSQRRPLRVVGAHPRLVLSLAIGIASYFLLPDSARLVSRLLIAWNLAAVFFMISTALMMSKATRDKQRPTRRDGRLPCVQSRLAAYKMVVSVTHVCSKAPPPRFGTTLLQYLHNLFARKPALYNRLSPQVENGLTFKRASSREQVTSDWFCALLACPALSLTSSPELTSFESWSVHDAKETDERSMQILGRVPQQF